MSENEWLKLPAEVMTLPRHTRVRGFGFTYEALIEARFGAGKFSDHGYVSDWRCDGNRHTYGNTAFNPVMIEAVQLPPGYVFRGSEVVRACVCTESSKCVQHFFGHDLGDTPEHLKPLLKRARAAFPQTVAMEHPDGGITLILTERGFNFALHVEGNSGNMVEDWVNGRMWRVYSFADVVRKAISEGRCYPTADAMRIGREEFGMVFGDESKPQADDLNAAIHASFKTGTEGIPKPQVKVGDNVKVLTSPITLDISGAAEGFGKALEDALNKLRGGPGARTCKCGSTTNVNLRLGVCAACHLEKRKAEVRAEMDRSVSKKCEESKAPKGWPEQFSGSSWEE